MLASKVCTNLPRVGVCPSYHRLDDFVVVILGHKPIGLLLPSVPLALNSKYEVDPLLFPVAGSAFFSTRLTVTVTVEESS